VFIQHGRPFERQECADKKPAVIIQRVRDRRGVCRIERNVVRVTCVAGNRLGSKYEIGEKRRARHVCKADYSTGLFVCQVVREVDA
jgi:hypothetical protein